MNLKEEELVDLIKEKKIGAKELTDSGICPTCFDRKYDGIVYGSKKDKLLYEDDDLECFLEGRPRSLGHTVIITKTHYKDMMDIPDDLCIKVFVFAKKMMNILKDVYQSESVYLCTMCDGLMNHFHIQLIPRYSYEERGSKNFVKTRKEYVQDVEKIALIKEKLSEK